MSVQFDLIGMPAAAAGVDRHPRTGQDELIGHPVELTAVDARVAVSQRGPCVVIAPAGGLDAVLADEIVGTVAAIARTALASILDVEQITLLDRAAFDVLLAGFEQSTDGRDRCLVANRLSGRLVLDRWGVSDRLATFGSVADALQARSFAADGYGLGWVPRRPS